MVTAIAGLETGAITTKEKINDVGVYKFSSDYNPKCWIYASYGRGHGYLNVTDAIVADEGLHDDDVIVIHDAVRPLVTEKILKYTFIT